MAALGCNTCTACACRVCFGIRSTIDRIFGALRVYGWMLDAYVVDFFTEDLWSKLPSSWRAVLEDVTPEELGKWILEESRDERVWPLSLLALRTFIKHAQIPRDHGLDVAIRCCSSSVDRPQKSLAPQIDEISAKDARFDNLFKKHVKPKKRYEIDVISKIAADSAREAGCDCVVDIGAGMGHLARVLAYRHDLRVACVERSPELLRGARKWDEQLAESLAKHLPDFRERKPPHQLSVQVESTSTARRQLAERLTCAFAEKFHGYGLIGLHPCGDLAATLLRLYSDETTSRFICIVGCCYMKLTLSGDAEKGYPMSQHLRSKSGNHELSYAALEVACHALEKHCDKLKTNEFHDLIVHAYRAVLEFLLIERNPDLRRTQLRNTKVKEDTGFREYCQNAADVLDSKDRPTDSDYERPDVKGFLKQWKRVLIFGTLRLFLAPLVETLVLFDRFLYLSEMNLSPSLKAEFDARVSPRNFLLVSIKKKDRRV